MTEHIKQQIEEKYDFISNENNDIAIREYNQRHYDQRTAAEYGYSLAEQEIAELERWKREAIAVMPDYQAIGKALNIKLGESVHDKILPEITRLKELIDRLWHYENAPNVTYGYLDREKQWLKFQTDNNL